jgi:hypothetical protein
MTLSHRATASRVLGSFPEAPFVPASADFVGTGSENVSQGGRVAWFGCCDQR